MDTRFVISCEHGGNRIPTPFRPWFPGCRALLASHRGYDPGALAMARALARTLAAPLVASTTSRLLVDLNRSPGHPRLHGEMLRAAPAAVRREVLERHYLPYRARIEQLISGALDEGATVLHVASHSFTPVLDGTVRDADVGLLYDPARPCELALCLAWQARLGERAPRLRVRRNYPYRGVSDGLCTFLRRRFPPERYVGVELEINQKHVLDGPGAWRGLRGDVAAALLAALGENAAAPRVPGVPLR